MSTATDWDDLSVGAVVFPLMNDGREALREHQEHRDYTTSSSYKLNVAHWRTDKPVHNVDHCINCYFCWVYCPDSSILVRDEKMVGVDYKHCKGCGLCSNVCPTNPKSLVMFNDQMDVDDALQQWPEKTKRVRD